mgnify:CR=1 FL=1
MWPIVFAVAYPIREQNATAAHHSVVTPLRFLRADPSGVQRRHLVTHKKRGRQLSNGGWELHGDLHTLGYFSADLCVGSPGRVFDLIVDTGSALTALPCQDCGHCGIHRHPGHNGARFSEKDSSTAERVSCSRPVEGMNSCHNCDNGACGYGVSYTEGSSIRGRLMLDQFWFAKPGGGRQGVRASFGCQTYESGLFNSQVADGITGFSQVLLLRLKHRGARPAWRRLGWRVG